MTHLTVNKMSERSGIDSKEIQRALFELHWVIKDNGELKINSPFGKELDSKYGRYIVWNVEILQNETFKAKLKSFNVTGEDLLTATQIGEVVNMKATEINSILVDINYLSKNQNGFFSDNKFAKQFITPDKKTYCKWKKDLLEDDLFKKATEKKEVQIPEVVKTETSKEAFKFDRKSFDAKFRTQSGHFVRSRGEVIVADWLYANDIMFAYEKRLPLVEEAYSDFYIKEKKIYIEVWGLESEKYIERKEKKIKMYKENGFNLIGLDDKDIENIDDFLALKLVQLGFQL